MRKITKQACHAFETGTDYKNSNTEVISKDILAGGSTSMYLHGNKIAHYSKAQGLGITLAGWNTNTTRERLNGLQGVRVSTKQGQAYLNGEKWDGEWITVTPEGKLIK